MFLFFEKIVYQEGQRYFRHEAKIIIHPYIGKILFGVADF
jgi:hypothetical protein